MGRFECVLFVYFFFFRLGDEGHRLVGNVDKVVLCKTQDNNETTVYHSWRERANFQKRRIFHRRGSSKWESSNLALQKSEFRHRQLLVENLRMKNVYWRKSFFQSWRARESNLEDLERATFYASGSLVGWKGKMICCVLQRVCIYCEYASFHFFYFFVLSLFLSVLRTYDSLIFFFFYGLFFY